MKNKKLKLARVEKDLSQAELAELVGVTRQTIGLIEAGGYNPTLNLCIAICRALDKTLDQLFWEEKLRWSRETMDDGDCWTSAAGKWNGLGGCDRKKPS